MRFPATQASALAALAVALVASAASPAAAQDGDVDLVRSAEEKSRAFTHALWCTAVLRLEVPGVEEARALDELRQLAPQFGHDSEDKLAVEIEQTMQGILQGDRYGPPLSPDEIEDLRSECIARYSDN